MSRTSSLFAKRSAQAELPREGKYPTFLAQHLLGKATQNQNATADKLALVSDKLSHVSMVIRTMHGPCFCLLGSPVFAFLQLDQIWLCDSCLKLSFAKIVLRCIIQRHAPSDSDLCSDFKTSVLSAMCNSCL